MSGEKYAACIPNTQQKRSWRAWYKVVAPHQFETITLHAKFTSPTAQLFTQAPLPTSPVPSIFYSQQGVKTPVRLRLELCYQATALCSKFETRPRRLEKKKKRSPYRYTTYINHLDARSYWPHLSRYHSGYFLRITSHLLYL